MYGPVPGGYRVQAVYRPTISTISVSPVVGPITTGVSPVSAMRLAGEPRLDRHDVAFGWRFRPPPYAEPLVWTLSGAVMAAPWLYLDADGFFASCEEAADSALHGRPVGVVAGDPYPDAPLIAVNTIAKRAGVRSGDRVACLVRS